MVELKTYQTQAAKEAVKRIVSNKNQTLVGKVGSGKTLTSLETCRRLSESGQGLRDTQHHLLTLVVVPNCVLHQWFKETLRFGVNENQLCLFHGSIKSRTKAFHAWCGRAGAVTNISGRTMWMLFTTFDTYRSSAALLSGVTWGMVIVDEAHLLRNGVAKTADEEIKYGLKNYEVLDRTLMRAPTRLWSPPFTLLVTATVVLNHPMDMLSLARWCRMPDGLMDKADWYNQQGVFKPARRQYCEDHVTVIDVPEPRPVERCVRLVKRDESERLLSDSAYQHLAGCLKIFLTAMRQMGSANRASPEQQAILRAARLQFWGAVTRCRRGEQFPGFFVQPTESAPRSLIASDVDRLVREHPLKECNKLRAVVDWCEELLDAENNFRKGLVMSAYKQPLQLLAEHVRRCKPDVAVFEHYGGGGKANAAILREFSAVSCEGRRAAVLLATRGSMGVGVDLPCVQRTFLMDLAWSRGDDQQALGRMQRPLAQKVHEWVATTASLGSETFSVEEWMRLIQEKKRSMVEEMFAGVDQSEDMDEEEDAMPAVEEPVQQPMEGKAETSKPILTVLLEMLERHGFVQASRKRKTPKKERKVSEKRQKVSSTDTQQAQVCETVGRD
ncbi:hypothetical protein CYMTET_37018 [Cymbomonas tetramitiformis]|uniref:Helicase ATP-binding domain-containing protein n=1 Tax=Cymbomonas tetramitiformis TaxID=36881 RepID=A0AAE0BUM6_9CHLO|nr:hypothetical protein CYMTET_47258 [Cymbomonas tetramitiformis]KAK3252084.1 hypothetical protein CYMTET_38642 [Cymbomonas tetramitiformis]KAK3253683.1 hypothetical protein CYMTET_37018 [Cymbomonas tetramitiformis]